ncbi:hypothetical protein ABIB94_007916 [Bradyrhizobium sp. JR7.2]
MRRFKSQIASPNRPSLRRARLSSPCNRTTVDPDSEHRSWEARWPSMEAFLHRLFAAKLDFPIWVHYVLTLGLVRIAFFAKVMADEYLRSYPLLLFVPRFLVVCPFRSRMRNCRDRYAGRSRRYVVAGVLLHRDDRRSGILLDPSSDRLVGLQRLHRCHQGDQGVHRRLRPPQGQGQHGHRACGRRHGTRRSHRPDDPVLGRRRLPLAGRGRAAPRRAGHGDPRLAISRR